jgi:hypothetical protein
MIACPQGTKSQVLWASWLALAKFAAQLQGEQIPDRYANSRSHACSVQFQIEGGVTGVASVSSDDACMHAAQLTLYCSDMAALQRATSMAIYAFLSLLPSLALALPCRLVAMAAALLGMVNTDKLPLRFHQHHHHA